MTKRYYFNENESVSEEDRKRMEFLKRRAELREQRELEERNNKVWQKIPRAVREGKMAYTDPEFDPKLEKLNEEKLPPEEYQKRYRQLLIDHWAQNE